MDGDLIEIIVDRNRLEGSVNLDHPRSDINARPLRPDLKPDPALPEDTRLWAALQDVSGGAWGGCVFDADLFCR